jgi:acyl carrier protein
MTLATLEDAQRLVVGALVEIAPDLEGTELAPEAELQADLGLDSMDFTSFVAALSDALGEDIPERDYSQLETVESCATYLHARTAA